MREFLTTREVADLLGTSTWRVRRLFEDGTFPEPSRFGGRRAIPKTAMFSCSWKDVEKQTMELAARVKKEIRAIIVKPGNEFEDPRLVLTACFVVAQGLLPEQEWLFEAVAQTNAEAPDNYAAKFTLELERRAQKLGKDFPKLREAARDLIPRNVLAPRTKELPKGVGNDAQSNAELSKAGCNSAELKALSSEALDALRRKPTAINQAAGDGPEQRQVTQ